MSNYFYKSSLGERGFVPVFALGQGIIVALGVSATTDNIQSYVDYGGPAPSVLQDAKHYKSMDGISSSSSSWDQRVMVKSNTPVMDKLRAEMDAFWAQVESGDFVFSEIDLEAAKEIVGIHPNIRI